MKRLIWLVVLLALAMTPRAMAQGQRVQGIVILPNGHPAANAEVRVCNQPATGAPCTPLTTPLYSDVTLNPATPKPNPFNVDSLGNYWFYVPAGLFTVQVTYAGQTWTYPDQGNSGVGNHDLLSATHLDTAPHTPPVNGDLIVGNGSNLWARFAGNTSTTPKVLFQTGDGAGNVVSSAWIAIGGDCSGGSQVVDRLNADGTVHCVSVPTALQVQHGGTLVGTRQILNLIDSPNNTWAVVDNAGQTRIDITANPVVTVDSNAATVGSQPAINFNDSATVTFAITNDLVNNRVNVTASSSAGQATYQKDSVTVASQPRLNFLTSPSVVPTVTNNPANNSVDVSLAASGSPPVPPAPFTIPAGQAVAWSFPTTCFAFQGSGHNVAFNPLSIGTFPTDATVTCGKSGGVVTRFGSGPLHDYYDFGMVWSGFQVPTLPNDAVIQAVYPVTIALRFGSTLIGASNIACGADTLVGSGTTYGGYFSNSNSLGSTAGTITGASCYIDSGSSLGLTGGNDTQVVQLIALAVYYTSATPLPVNTNFFFANPYYPSINGISIPFTSLADASPLAYNAGNNFILNRFTVLNHLTTTRALNASAMQSGGVYRLRLQQDATGGAALTLGTGCTWILNNVATSAIPIPTAPNAVSDLEWVYDGTNCLATFVVSSGSSTLSYLGAWQSTTAYAVGNIVTYNGSSWIAVAPSTGTTPGTDNGTVWALFAAAGQNGANGTNGTNGAPGVPGYSPNQVISGGGVAWTGSGLNFSVSPTTYLIQNTQYSSPLTTVTLSAADPSLDRIDAIIVNNTGNATFITGTPSATPVPPAIDITSQLQLTFVYVAAGATAPSNITVADIYHENAEWTCSTSGASVSCSSATTPHTGSLNIMYTNAATGAYAQQTIPVGTVDLGQWTNFITWVKLDAAMPVGRSLILQWYNGTTAACTPVTLAPGNFGFNGGITTWQQVVIPSSTFACSGIPVTRIRESVAGSGSNLTIHVDDIQLQGGLAGATSSASLSPCNDWNSTTSYAVNSCVYYSVTGSSYWAIQANTNKVPTNSANWKPLEIHGPAGIPGNVQVNVGGNSFGAINTSVSGADVTWPGQLIASAFVSNDTLHNSEVTGTTGSLGDSSCPAPLVGTSYQCIKSSVWQFAQNGASYLPPALVSGATTAGHCAQFDASGNVVDAGGVCGTGSGSVSSFSAGDLSPLFTSSVATPTSSPALTFTLSAAAAHTFLGNNTGSTGAPAYASIGTADLPFTYSGSTTKLGTVSGSTTTNHCAIFDASGNLIDGGACGTVTTTGSPSANQMAKFSGASSITTSLFTDDGTTATYTGTGGINAKQVVIPGATSGTITLVVPTVAGTTTITFPAVTGTVVLGTGVAGNCMQWTATGAGDAGAPCGTGSITWPGSNTQLIYNLAGTGAGAQYATYDNANKGITLGDGTTRGVLDQKGDTGAPSNPAANYCRQYFDTTAGVTKWINSSGTSCGPAPSTTPGTVLLWEATASSSATLDCTTRNATGQSGTCIQTDYDEYLIEVLNVCPVSGSTDFLLEVSKDGGSTWDTTSGHYTAGACFGYSSAGTTNCAGTISTAIRIAGYAAGRVGNCSNAADSGVSATIRLTNPLSTTLPKQFRTADVALYDTAIPGNASITQMPFYNQTGAGTGVNALRFVESSGNLASGTIRIYGVSK